MNTWVALWVLGCPYEYLAAPMNTWVALWILGCRYEKLGYLCEYLCTFKNTLVCLEILEYPCEHSGAP